MLIKYKQKIYILFLNIFQFSTQLPMKMELEVLLDLERSSIVKYVLNFTILFLSIYNIKVLIKNIIFITKNTC
jgi:hypothetical protein